MKYLKYYESFEQPEGTGAESSWEVEIDGKPIKITLSEVINHIDDVIEIDPNQIKDLLIDTERDPQRVEAADYKNYPIVLVSKSGKFISILDGQHRVVKALRDGVKIKAQILNLDKSPEKFLLVFDR